MNFSIKIEKDHEEKVLKMFEYFFQQELENENFPYFIDTGLVLYNTKKSPIHWYELVVNILSRKIFNDQFYWMGVFVNRCVQFYTPESDHIVDFLYEKFEIVKNKESLFKKTELDFVIEKENKENKKAQRKVEKAQTDKQLKKKAKEEKIIESKEEPPKKNKKESLEEDFFTS